MGLRIKGEELKTSTERMGEGKKKGREGGRATDRQTVRH